MEYTILEQIKIRLRKYTVDDSGEIVFTTDADDFFLTQLIAEAENDVKRCRNYPSSYTDEQIESDMEQFDGLIVKLVIYDFNKEGVDFESQDSENGYLRTYVTREKLLADVLPLVHVL